MGLREREARQRERVRDIEIEMEDEEAVQPRTTTATYTPSQEEFERHSQTHLPYRIGARYASSRRRKIHRPVISMHYMYLNDKKGDNNPILVIHGSESEGIWAIRASARVTTSTSSGAPRKSSSVSAT